MGNTIPVMEPLQVYEIGPLQVEEEQVEEEISSEERGEEETSVKKTEEAPEEEKDKLKVTMIVDEIKTAPMEFRFPTTKQAKHCFTRHNEYHKYYRSLCPGEWVDKWNEERNNGIYAGRY